MSVETPTTGDRWARADEYRPPSKRERSDLPIALDEWAFSITTEAGEVHGWYWEQFRALSRRLRASPGQA